MGRDLTRAYDGTSLTLHGSCVAVSPNAGVLITGPSGAGKSALAIEMMSRGAVLIADDQVILSRQADSLIATCPSPIKGLIEARGLGILTAPTLPQAAITLLVDLSQFETSRLPPPRYREILGLDLPLSLGIPAPHFAAALMLYLKGERRE